MTVWQTRAVAASGITKESAAGSAVQARAKVLTDTQAAEDAVLRPQDCGAWSHAVRAALAARIARLNGEHSLANDFLAAFRGDPTAQLADPACDGSAQAMPAAVRFMDRVAARPKDIRAGDIKELQDSGIADADIVRLCELNAFLAYQIRLITGLRLLAGPV